jgi:prepilin-type N-terminal cleavage/methylation domain-containing protein
MNTALPTPRSVRSARGHRPVVSTAVRAFTILEILLALAIIGLLAAVLIGGSASVLADRPATADEVFEKVVQQARKTALKSQKEVRLVFRKDGDTKRFALVDTAAPAASADPFAFAFAVPDPNAGTIAEYPIPNASGLEVSFLSTQKGGNLILIGGMAVGTSTIPYVTFYSDGTCTPFRAQFVSTGVPRTIAIDPWTCAQMLTPADPNAPR